MEPYEYPMSKSGRYRCKFCHQYLKTNKLVCRHTNKCKSQYSFKIKTYNLYENAEESFVDKEDNEKKSDDDEEIDKIMSKVVEIKKKKLR